MRRFFLGVAIAACIAATPSLLLADDPQVIAHRQFMKQKIGENIENSGALKGYRIRIDYQDGTAVLTGTVADAQQKASALAITRSTDGVYQVIDQLTVGAPSANIQPTGGNFALPAGMPQQSLDSYSRYHGQQALPPAYSQQPSQQQQAQAIPRGFAPSMSVPASYGAPAQLGAMHGQPMPAHVPGAGGGIAPARYDRPHMPNYAWPAYAAYPNYAAVTYPQQYSPTAWPFIGPFYPYPQVPLGWRKVTLEWDDGWWMLDFKARRY